jgi:putative transposase
VNAQQGASPFLVPHETYKRLGSNEEDRRLAYRELLRSDLEPEMVDRIRKATNGNYALGSERFAEEVALMLARRVTPGKSGRPRKRDIGRDKGLL